MEEGGLEGLPLNVGLKDWMAFLDRRARHTTEMEQCWYMVMFGPESWGHLHDIAEWDDYVVAGPVVDERTAPILSKLLAELPKEERWFLMAAVVGPVIPEEQIERALDLLEQWAMRLEEAGLLFEDDLGKVRVDFSEVEWWTPRNLLVLFKDASVEGLLSRLGLHRLCDLARIEWDGHSYLDLQKADDALDEIQKRFM